MNSTDRQRYEMLTRVRNFGLTYGQLFPETSHAPQALATIAAAIDQIQAHEVAEKTATASARATRKSAARRALVEQLVKVAATARVIAETNSHLDARFELLPRPTDQVLLTTARQFAKNAAPFSAEFVAHGMPPTFLTDLQALIDSFEGALRDRGMSRDEQLAARATIKAALSAARAAVRKLDVIVANHAGLDAVVREVWVRDRRIGTPRQASKGAVQEANLKAPETPAAQTAAPGREPATPTTQAATNTAQAATDTAA